MKLINFKNKTDCNWVVIIPTITLFFNDPIYIRKNFAIELHWLVFHIRWLFEREVKQ